MSVKKFLLPGCLAALGLAALVGSITAADAPTSNVEMKLPPGWTEADMMACMEAGTPGAEHKRLAADVGEWTSECMMWMAPDTEPLKSQGTSEVTTILDGRFTHVEMEGDMMGQPFKGYGLYGFDNVAKKYVSTWIDSMTTGIMTGDGKASSDGKTITWTYTGNCPLTKKPITMREIDTTVDANTKTLEMWGPDPKTGKEYKSMFITLKRKK
jgi:hypothetical protein